MIPDEFLGPMTWFQSHGLNDPRSCLFSDNLGLVSDRGGEKCSGRKTGKIGLTGYKVFLI